jgi:hypothetical protein
MDSNGKDKNSKKELGTQAENFARNGEWDKAAACFARSNRPFEDTALMLLSLGCGLQDLVRQEIDQIVGNSSKGGIVSTITSSSGTGTVPAVTSAAVDVYSAAALDPLRIFLLEVLLHLPLSAKSQRTMLCTWLVEIFLHQIMTRQLTGRVDEEQRSTADCTAFFRANRSSFDVSTVLQLIVSRNHRPLLLFFVKIMGDYYRATCVLMSEKRYAEAITGIVCILLSFFLFLYLSFVLSVSLSLSLSLSLSPSFFLSLSHTLINLPIHQHSAVRCADGEDQQFPLQSDTHFGHRRA